MSAVQDPYRWSVADVGSWAFQWAASRVFTAMEPDPIAPEELRRQFETAQINGQQLFELNEHSRKPDFTALLEGYTRDILKAIEALKDELNASHGGSADPLATTTPSRLTSTDRYSVHPDPIRADYPLGAAPSARNKFFFIDSLTMVPGSGRLTERGIAFASELKGREARLDYFVKKRTIHALSSPSAKKHCGSGRDAQSGSGRETFNHGGKEVTAYIAHPERLVPEGLPHNTYVISQGKTDIKDLNALRLEQEEEFAMDASEAAITERAIAAASRKRKLGEMEVFEDSIRPRPNDEHIRRRALQAAKEVRRETDREMDIEALFDGLSGTGPRIRATLLANFIRDALKDRALLPLLHRGLKGNRLAKHNTTAAVIESAIISHQGLWDIIRRHDLNPMTGTLWTQLTNDSQRTRATRKVTAHIANMEAKLHKYVSAIQEQSWGHQTAIHQQCDALAQTIRCIELAKWRLNVLSRPVQKKAIPIVHMATSMVNPGRPGWDYDRRNMIGYRLMDNSEEDNEVSQTLPKTSEALSQAPQTLADTSDGLSAAPQALDETPDAVPAGSQAPLTMDVIMEDTSADNHVDVPSANPSGQVKDVKEIDFTRVSVAEIESWHIDRLPFPRSFMFLVKLVHTIPEDNVSKLLNDVGKTSSKKNEMADHCRRVMNILKLRDLNKAKGEPFHFDTYMKIIRLRMAYECNTVQPWYDEITAMSQWRNWCRASGLDEKKDVMKEWRAFINVFRKILDSWKAPTATYIAKCSPEDRLPALDLAPDKSRFFSLIGRLDDCMAKKQSKVWDRYSAHLLARDPEQEVLDRLRDRKEYRNYKYTPVVLNPLASQESWVVVPQDDKSAGLPPLLPHQVEGLRFLWREIVEAEEQEGCVLAHTMGLGKSRQILDFLQTLHSAGQSPNLAVSSLVPQHLQKLRTLLICPASVCDNWVNEHTKWGSFEDGFVCSGFFSVRGTANLPHRRMLELREWHWRGGLFVISYEMFSTYTSFNLPNKDPTVYPEGISFVAPSKSSKEYHDLKAIQEFLLDSPNVVIADESQRIKNLKTKVAQCAARFKTKSRIALSGTPLSNNITEYFSSIDWVAPGYLGTSQQFNSLYGKPIEKGLYSNSSPADFKLSRDVQELLRKTVYPKIHRRNIKAIENSLHGKDEFIIYLPLTGIQKEIYKEYVTRLKTDDRENSFRIFGWLSVLASLNTHPQLFLDRLTDRTKKPISLASDPTFKDDHGRIPCFDIESDQQPHVKDLLIESPLVNYLKGKLKAHKHLKDVGNSLKVKMLLTILKHCQQVGDKVLVFSQYTSTLDFLEKHLKANEFNYRRIDGGSLPSKRVSECKDFNSESHWSMYLVSTLAGGTGLNMFGANRVITFDHMFNPALEEQAVGRAFRLGQQKRVFVYHLSLGGTFEAALHNTKVYKQQLAARVVDNVAVKPQATSVREYIFEPREGLGYEMSPVAASDSGVLGPVLAAREVPILGISTADRYRALNPEEVGGDSGEGLAVGTVVGGAEEMVLALRRRGMEGMEREERGFTKAPAAEDTESGEKDSSI